MASRAARLARRLRLRRRFIYASLAFIRRKAMPFVMFCDRRVTDVVLGHRGVKIVFDAPGGCATRIILTREAKPLPTSMVVETAFGLAAPLLSWPDRIEIEALAGSGALTLTWSYTEVPAHRKPSRRWPASAHLSALPLERIANFGRVRPVGASRAL